ncbi:hypothetical protein LEP1GSC062_0025, partial [Leptospira alexanderi serovar Manhao 3 str. L 60]
MNNIGRDNQSSGVSANIRGQYGQGSSGSLGLSYDTKAGYGATVGLTSGLGPLLSVTPSWTVSEYGGLSSDVQYGFNKNLFGNLFSKPNNPDHSAANRNLLDDILNGMGSLVSGIGAVGKSAWDGAVGAMGGINGENLSNGWNAIKKALFGGDHGGDANALDMEYAEMQEQMSSMMDGDALTDNSEMPSANKLSLAKVGRLKTEIDAYLDYKEGKISKGDFEAKVAEARKNYYYQTQGERNKIPIAGSQSYTDISGSNLDTLVRLEAKKGVLGRILEDENGNVYFRTEALGMKSKSIQME